MSTRLTKLSSGITVLSEAFAHVKTAALGIWVGTGSRFELPEEHGISHVLEHMAFKGTRRRSSRQIAEEIEAVGGDLNAATSVEVTAYYARVLGEDMPLALDILTDILTDPTFDAAELAREQNVIIQEIGAAADTPDDLVFDLFQDRAFKGQAIGRPILGTPASVRATTPARLRAYMGRQYGTGNVVVAAAGAIDHDMIVREIERRLAAMPALEAAPAEQARYVGGMELGARQLEQAHLVLGLEGRSYHSPDIYAMQVFTHLLGGGMSSRLFQEVREKRGLCYTISAFHSAFADTGLFGVYAGTDSGDTAELMRVAIGELADAAANAGEAEVGRARAQLKVGLLTALESPQARAEQIARQMLAFGRVIPVDEIVAKIDAVGVAEARAAGRVLLDRGRPTLAALGPGAGLEAAARIVDSLARRAA
jgi:predicted Zn-dependent peptidase